MAKKYVGNIVMEVDSTDFSVVSLDVTRGGLRKVVKTMNKEGRADGSVELTPDYSLRAEVVIPKTGDIDWDAIDDAKITIYPREGGGKRVSYLECGVTDVGERYNVNDEARRTLDMYALDKIEE